MDHIQKSGTRDLAKVHLVEMLSVLEHGTPLLALPSLGIVPGGGTLERCLEFRLLLLRHNRLDARLPDGGDLEIG